MFKHYKQCLISLRNLIRLNNNNHYTQNPSLYYYHPKRYILQNAPRLRSKFKKQEFEIPRIDQKLFVDESSYLLNRLYNAFNEFQKDEPRVQKIELLNESEIEHNNPEDQDQYFSKILIVEISHIGEYNFKIDMKNQIVYMSSPLSGIMKYYYDTQNERWLNNKDKHIIEELLVRELTKYCQGLINLQCVEEIKAFIQQISLY